jgi:fucose 4-O-acetylase-like acetyltransferase
LLVPYAAVTVGMLVYRCTRQGLWYAYTPAERLRMGFASVVYALPAAFENVPLLHTSTIGIGPIWFLPCFFFAEVLYRLMARLRFRLPLACALALAATWSQSKFLLPLTLQDAFIGCAFIALGDFCRPFVLRYAEWLSEKKWPWSAALTLASYSMLLVGLTHLPGQGLDLGSNYYNPLSLFSTCMGFWFVISASVLLRHSAVPDEFLAFCGKNSFLILVLHNMDILGLRNWANTDANFLVCTLLLYPFLVYLWDRARAAVPKPHGGAHSHAPEEAEPAVELAVGPENEPAAEPEQEQEPEQIPAGVGATE